MDDNEEELLRSVALQNAQSILAARQRMERDGDIEVYDDVLAKLAANEPAAGAPFPGGAPFSIPGGQ